MKAHKELVYCLAVAKDGRLFILQMITALSGVITV